VTAAPLLELGSDVGWPDVEAAAAARSHAGGRHGRLAELVEWLAGAQGKYPPQPPRRTRCATLGQVPEPVAELAASLDVGLLEVDPPPRVADAFPLGAEVADDEVDAGADLLVLAGRDSSSAAAALVSLVTGAEPVALLPRGAAAVDAERWIADAAALRDLRRRVSAARDHPDELLAALGSPVLATAAGFAMGTAARRTPIVLAGTVVLAAALLCADAQPRAREWWQVADTSPDRAAARAVEHLELRPVLSLGTGGDDGTAGLLAVAVLRAAVTTDTSDG
jgi:nicotinate-nucleotide--dimethylbenzimidazole phosphoribosyltransferase